MGWRMLILLEMRFEGMGAEAKGVRDVDTP